MNAKIGLFLRPLTRGDQYVVRSGQVVCRSDYEKEFFLVQSFAAAAAASSGGGGGTGGGSGLPAQSNLAPQVCSLTSLMFQSMFSGVKSIASSYGNVNRNVLMTRPDALTASPNPAFGDTFSQLCRQAFYCPVIKTNIRTEYLSFHQ